MPEQQKVWPNLKAATDLNYTLYGGTAIALRLGHRQSVDFDFFSSEPQNAKKLIAVMPFLKAAEIIQDAPDTRTYKVPVDGKEVKISFFNDMDMGRVGTPEFTPDGMIRVASPEDLMATKLKALMERSAAKDYQDIAEMCRAGYSIKTGLGAAATIYAPNFSPVLGVKSLIFFDDGDLHRLSQEDKDTIIETVKALDLNTILKIPILSKDLANDRVMNNASERDVNISKEEELG